jgi:chromosome partitioning protein
MVEAKLTALEIPDLSTAHVIVTGTATGGTGKSMLSILISIALLRSGFNIATIDLDQDKRTMTRFFENRQIFAANPPWLVELPFHQQPPGDNADHGANGEAGEFSAFAKALEKAERDFEFIVIDTPAMASPLVRLAHSLADTLVSPIDLALCIEADQTGHASFEAYMDLVGRARQNRKAIDSGLIDWVLADVENAPQPADAWLDIENKAPGLRVRLVEGLREKSTFEEFFALGLTALDPIEDTTSRRTLLPSQRIARREAEKLFLDLQLPERGKAMAHADARQKWFSRMTDFYHNPSQKE